MGILHGGRYLKKTENKEGFSMPWFLIPVAYALIEVFAFLFLLDEAIDWWPLAFGALWAGLLTGLVFVLPRLPGRIFFGISYFVFFLYTAAQTGYFILFEQMLWVSEFRYASEGSEFFSVLLQYPIGWWLFLIGLVALGVLILWKYPRYRRNWQRSVLAGVLAGACITGTVLLPNAVVQHDRQIQYAGSDYGRAQSAEAAYNNMFNTYRLYQVCGIYQTAVKDIYKDYIYPSLPAYAAYRAEASKTIDEYFAVRRRHMQ